MSDSLFEVKDIWKEFLLPNGQGLRVLEKISFSLNPNEVLAVIGPSGCGKSTLLRIIAGLIPATKGEIQYHGQKCVGLMPGNSMIFQNFALYPWLTVQENIEIALKAKHVSSEEMKKKTKDVISLIGLHGFEEAYPREISGGMKQRVGIARALVRSPEMLFMDEPFSNLDAFTAENLRSEMIRILSNKELGLQSILIVSHDIYEVVYMADRIVFLSANPAQIHTILENKIPKPRDYSSPDFLNLVKELHDIYSQVESTHTKPKKVSVR
jgi:NitT/TauT family transport system ATP-binding protein